MLRIVLLALGLGFLTSCSGYQFGGNKPEHLRGTQSVSIPLAKSRVIFPRVEALATNSMVDALVSDGTYRLKKSSVADATLVITVEAIDYQQVRSSTVDVLRSEELQLLVTVSYKLTDNNHLGVVLDAGQERGNSRLFVDDNLQTARMNALPDALQRATQSIIARLADGI
jgi:outer membrane lipopolysaccharide assembly protein LptE/RlpB